MAGLATVAVAFTSLLLLIQDDRGAPDGTSEVPEKAKVTAPRPEVRAPSPVQEPAKRLAARPQTPARDKAAKPTKVAKAPTKPVVQELVASGTALIADTQRASPAPVPQPPPAPASSGPTHTGNPMEEGLALAAGNRPVEARRALTNVLLLGGLGTADADFVRDALDSLNRRLVFGPEVASGDPFSRAHIVQPGERLGSIVKSESLAVDWRFILRINHLLSERHLREGQRLKLVTGPFHAVIDKSEYRLDLYLGVGDQRVFVTDFPVGLGEHDSTPIGTFRVRESSKLVNPAWSNPRTGEHFDRDDPLNPIGEHWIGLIGTDEATLGLAGYGIHGTIEPDSIGRQSSMGCIRMQPEDVALIYEMLMERTSTVEIRP